MLPVGFEPTISAGERPKTYALDCAATGTGEEHIDMLERLNGLLILSTDKVKYFSKFLPSVVLCVSVSFALYYETNFGRLLSSALGHVKHLPLIFSFAE